VLALVKRDWLVTRSYRLPFVLDLFFGVVNLAVYFFISRTFAGAALDKLGGAPSYFAFATVGIVLTGVLSAAATGLAGRLREEQLTGTLEALLAQPITVQELSLGLVGFPFLFAGIRGAFYLLLAVLAFGVDVSHMSWAGFFLCLLAGAAAFSALGVLLGAVVLVLKRGEVLVGLLTFGMGLVGGAFFPVSVLPNWLEPIGRIVPTGLAFHGVRSAAFVGTGWAGDAIALACMGAIGLPIAVWVFGRALAYAERSGTIAQY